MIRPYLPFWSHFLLLSCSFSCWSQSVSSVLLEQSGHHFASFLNVIPIGVEMGALSRSAYWERTYKGKNKRQKGTNLRSKQRKSSVKKPEDQKTRMEKGSRREFKIKKLNENQPKEKRTGGRHVSVGCTSTDSTKHKPQDIEANTEYGLNVYRLFFLSWLPKQYRIGGIYTVFSNCKYPEVMKSIWCA